MDNDISLRGSAIIGCITRCIPSVSLSHAPLLKEKSQKVKFDARVSNDNCNMPLK